MVVCVGNANVQKNPTEQLLTIGQSIGASGLDKIDQLKIARSGFPVPPHVLRHLDPFSNLALALIEELLRGFVRSDLLAFEDAINPIANPPDFTARLALPKTSDWLPLSRHEYPSRTKIAKYHQKYTRHFWA